MRQALITLAILLGLLLPISVHAQSVVPLPYEDTFEDADGNLTARQYGTGSCPTSSPDGCNPTRSSLRSYLGTKSLLKDYTGPIVGGDENHGYFITKFHVPSAHVWVRYMSYLQNYVFCTGAACIDKIHYIYPPNLTPGPSWVPAFYFGSTIVVGSQADSSANAPCSGATSPGPFNSCIYTPNENVSFGSHPQNQWVCIEEHVWTNSSVGGVPQADGGLEVFRDSVRFMNYTGRRWSGVGQVYQNFAGGWTRWYTQTGGGRHFIDNVLVSSTRMGCPGAPPPIDTTPPNPVTGLEIE